MSDTDKRSDAEPAGEGDAAAWQDPVHEYKALLRAVLDRRPSGTRLRLAEAMGKNRSFISQISNPAYPTPIPADHITPIMEVCHFSAQEKERFMDAYRRAHPQRFDKLQAVGKVRRLTIDLPDLGDPAANKALDAAIEDVATRVARLFAEQRQK